MSQIVAATVRYDPPYASSSDEVRVPQEVRDLLADVLLGVTAGRSEEEISIVTEVVRELTTSLENDVFLIDPGLN